MNPIRQSIRDALAFISNGPRNWRDLMNDQRIAESSALHRMRTLVEAGYAVKEDGKHAITEKGMEALMHAPVLQKNSMVNTYSKAVPGPSPLAKRGDYVPIELQRPAGVTADRFDAFNLPSRMGDWLYYPDGRKEKAT